ncbi:hypothetical protein [Methylosinus sp. Sm6]|uniref:hypothetical protein n=1 Tax=Methylosinus sp. Sm6 TaxID=2866948 RepID=UPI001C99031B|nr:hypothetical protein [Methylosinus sp. Sm6]MBY6240826.1 hypothetical protein [Methylosinus sp. Sm6]
MIRSKSPKETLPTGNAGAEFDRLTALIGMIDYLIVEAREIEPLAEYFLKMARLSLLEAEQTRADADGRN